VASHLFLLHCELTLTTFKFCGSAMPASTNIKFSLYAPNFLGTIPKFITGNKIRETCIIEHFEKVVSQLLL
jgi:hypothetical protein